MARRKSHESRLFPDLTLEPVGVACGAVAHAKSVSAPSQACREVTSTQHASLSTHHPPGASTGSARPYVKLSQIRRQSCTLHIRTQTRTKAPRFK